MRRQYFGRPEMTAAAAMSQLKVNLASATDQALLALTVDQILATHKIKRREAECVLLAAQDTRRREIARRDQSTKDEGHE